MPEGPFEYVLVRFPGERFRAELVSALIDLVGLGNVRILDLVIIKKDAEGGVASMEIHELDDDTRELFFDLDGEYDGLFSDEDIALAADEIASGDMAVALIWEDIWAAKFAAAVREAAGEVVVSERLPRAAVQQALTELVSA